MVARKEPFMTRSTIKWSLPALVIILFVSSTAAWGQYGASTIRGTITDPSGAVVGGATVTITNLETNLSRSQTTSSTGSYSFELIPTGEYKVEIEAKGFRKSVVPRVHALVGSVIEVSQKLQVGEISTTVEVQAGSGAVQVNTQDATLGNNIEHSQIIDLPLEARRVADLLTLQPGVTRDGYVAGARADQSNVTLDGVDINDQQANQLTGANETEGMVLRLNAEAIEEFRVNTVNANANEGRSSAAQINLVSKTGTNNWHGALFEFYRGTLFEANDWFSNKAGVPRTPLVRNTFGGMVSGPIKKDKLFFIFSYEGLRNATATPVTRIVPLASLGQGIIKYRYCTDPSCANLAIASLSLAQNQQVYSTAGINPAALAALASAASKYPANDTTLGDGLNTSGFRFNAPTPTNLNSSYARFDFVPSHNQNAFLRLNLIDDHLTLIKRFPDTVSPLTWSHPFGLAVGHTWSIGNNLVNNARYGYTRQAFSDTGDSTGNDISFRFVFQPTGHIHNLSRVTPVHNITDDVSWVHGKHVFQFGVNVRAVSNARVSFANAFDNAVTNPSFYLGAGDHISTDFQNYLTANNLPGGQAGQSLASSFTANVQNAATAIIGRFSQYTANFTFNQDGSLLSAGSPSSRNFATQAYEVYFQDSWKFRPHLTFTLGLRYSLERPVYETSGFEVSPIVPLGTYFQDRLAAAALGNNFVDPIVVDRSGPMNGGKPMYNWDKDNFQPRIAVAWSPSFSHGLLHALFGEGNQSVLRGGFSLTNDYFGQALAVDWDLNNTLGFTSNFTTPANTYDTDNCSTCSGLAPLFTGFNQNIHSLPGVVVPGNLSFPLSQPLDQGERIETSVDSNLQAPNEYVWNATFERQIARGTKLSFSYIGRYAHHLLARRDEVAFNDLVDPKSGMDWYTAGTLLEKQRQQGLPTSAIAAIPFFENLFPAGLATMMNATFGLDPVCSGGNAGFVPTWTNTQVFYAMQSRTPSNPCAFFAGNDWTDAQALIDQVLASNSFPTRFMQPQYGALSAWSTIGNSSYNGLTVSLRQRLSSLTVDVNYTFSHSLDDSSGLQNETGYGAAFIVNPIRQRSWYGSSDFDIRHLINATAVWQMPFGKGRPFLNTPNHALQAVVGGWQLSGIYRWNTGLPLDTMPYDDARWATNWNVQANVTPTSPVQTCPDRSNTPKLFGTGCNIKAIYQTFRNAYPGESGPRNYLRAPGFMDADLGLSKTMAMPYNEQHKLQFRWDVFNVANFQPFGTIDSSRTGFGVARDPKLRNAAPPSNWSNFTAIQGKPRVMQIALRYSF
jgi:Carboxypeptidase regulatory-like domain